MYAYVTMRGPDGERVRLGHGDFVGRLWSAALCIDDPRVSEAHAMVSLRLGELRMLALRGRFAVGRRVLADVRLVPGLRLELTPETTLTVEEVVLPRQLLAVEGEGLPRQVLSGSCGLVLDPEPSIVTPVPPSYAAAFWHNGSGWRLRLSGSAAGPLLVGDEWTCEGRTFRAVAVDAGRGGDGVTVVDGGLEQSLRIVTRYDTVHLFQNGHGNPDDAASGAEPVVISGLGARLMSELVAFDGPVHWRVLAEEIWGDVDESSLRRRLDVCASRLRSRLRESGVRPDLVRATGTGHYELHLHARDVVEDEA